VSAPSLLCEACQESLAEYGEGFVRPAVARVSVTDPEGVVLLTFATCAECAPGQMVDVESEIAKAERLRVAAARGLRLACPECFGPLSLECPCDGSRFEDRSARPFGHGIECEYGHTRICGACSWSEARQAMPPTIKGPMPTGSGTGSGSSPARGSE
jgi:hypothetical protein